MKEKVETAQITIVKKLTISTTLIAVAVLAPVIGGHTQWITGPLVNATLYAAVIMVGLKEALMVGLFPSLIALGVGLLPTAIAPIIPFIILGNAVLSTVFAKIKDKNPLIAIFTASFAKYAFLAFFTTTFTRVFLGQKALALSLKMFTWAQFATALAGGLLSLSILHGRSILEQIKAGTKNISTH